MKRLTQILCMIMVFVTVLSTAAFAAETPAPRASNFFMSSSVYFWHVSGDNYQIWFDVTALSTMQKLGASKIKVQRSTDKVNWTTVKTYDMADYSQMTTSNAVTYINCVPFTATSGYYYRAVVTLYAKNSSGTGEMDEVTATLNLR
jgi:hypothetical protein